METHPRDADADFRSGWCIKVSRHRQGEHQREVKQVRASGRANERAEGRPPTRRCATAVPAYLHYAGRWLNLVVFFFPASFRNARDSINLSGPFYFFSLVWFFLFFWLPGLRLVSNIGPPESCIAYSRSSGLG